jgi:hypothetical protein
MPLLVNSSTVPLISLTAYPNITVRFKPGSAPTRRSPSQDRLVPTPSVSSYSASSPASRSRAAATPSLRCGWLRQKLGPKRHLVPGLLGVRPGRRTEGGCRGPVASGATCAAEQRKLLTIVASSGRQRGGREPPRNLGANRPCNASAADPAPTLAPQVQISPARRATRIVGAPRWYETGLPERMRSCRTSRRC